MALSYVALDDALRPAVAAAAASTAGSGGRPCLFARQAADGRLALDPAHAPRGQAPDDAGPAAGPGRGAARADVQGDGGCAAPSSTRAAEDADAEDQGRDRVAAGALPSGGGGAAAAAAAAVAALESGVCGQIFIGMVATQVRQYDARK
jgi:hypothetical protein